MSDTRTMNPFLRLALDLGPLLLFFFANWAAGIYTATAVFMVAMSVSFAAGFSIERKLSPMPLVTFVLVVVFGGLTLWLENEIFIKIKPTILYLMFAAVLLGGLAARRLFLKILLAQSLKMPEAAWRVLTWRWSAFFLGLAFLNEIVWRNFSTDYWVAFKVWGVLPLTLLFVISQTPYIARHQVEEDTSPAGG